MMESAKGKDIRTFAHKTAPNAQSISGAWNFCENRKKPNPKIKEGIAKYMFPEKAMSRFMKFVVFDFFTLWFMLKFLLVSLIKRANITVSMLENVAMPKLVKRDFKNSSSVKIFIKFAPKPSIKMEIRGKIKRVVETQIIEI